MADLTTRCRWLAPLKNSPKGEKPSNFAIIEAVRKPFGQCGAAQCVAKARRTGQRCLSPAVRGAKCCRVHGGLKWGLEAHKKINPRYTLALTDTRISSRFYSTVAILESDVLSEMPMEVRKKANTKGLRARGRKIESFLNTGKLDDEE